jgi:hypothetical protein
MVVTIGLALLGALMVGVAQITGDSGSKLNSLGTEVVVGDIGVTVLRIRMAPGREDVVPHFVDARFANKGPSAVARNLAVGLEDEDDDSIRRPIIVLGNEWDEVCREVRRGALEPGESYESCTLFLVPEDVDVARVYFVSDQGPDRPPELVYWATE